MTNLIIRAAALSDYGPITGYDEFIGDRRINLQAGEITVADMNGRAAIAYRRIAPQQFLGWPLLAILCVKNEYRRKGIGLKLIETAIADSRFVRLYTTTEESNSAMRGLLERVSAAYIGHADKLNINGDRELLYRLK